jgi:hypothetical protein
MEEEDHIHSTQLTAPAALLYFSLILLTISLHSLSISSLPYASIYRHDGETRSIKYGTNYATTCASTLYQMGDELFHLYKVEVGYLPQ